MWESEQTLRWWRMWGCEVFVTHLRASPSLQIQNSIWIFCIWFFSCPSHHQLIHVKHYIIFFLLFVILQINGGDFIFRWTESFLIIRNMKEKKGLIFHKPHQSPVCCRLHHHCCSRWFRLPSPAWHTKKIRRVQLKEHFLHHTNYTIPIITYSHSPWIYIAILHWLLRHLPEALQALCKNVSHK